MQDMGQNSLRDRYYLIKLGAYLVFIIFSMKIPAAEYCSRIAIINYQEVLVDTSSTSRGEGLRYYLQKDPIAKKLLDQYKENEKPTWQATTVSTLGTSMLLFGILRTSAGDGELLTNKKTLMYGGLSLIGLSFLISRTIQYNNENLLFQSVEEYNKRNTPKIYLSTGFESSSSGLGLGVSKDF
jgi:hypothetical protein